MLPLSGSGTAWGTGLRSAGNLVFMVWLPRIAMQHAGLARIAPGLGYGFQDSACLLARDACLLSGVRGYVCMEMGRGVGRKGIGFYGRFCSAHKLAAAGPS